MTALLNALATFLMAYAELEVAVDDTRSNG